MSKHSSRHPLYSIWDKVPLTYYQHGTKRNILQRIWHGRKIRLATDILNTLSFENCLDVGCASGYMISQIAKRFPKKKYYGVDIYDKAIDYAKKKYPQIQFAVAAADDLPFENNKFDLILFYETIEHVEDPLKSLREIKRVLSQKGSLILAMDSGSILFRTVWFLWENTVGSIWKGAHLHPFHHSELEALIKKAGFKIQRKQFSHLGMEVVFVLGK